jgi:Glycosyltransferase family 87
VSDRRYPWRRLLRDGLVVVGIVAAVAYWWYLTTTGGDPVDVRWYWAADPNNLYPHPELGEHNGYNYSPAFEWIVGWWRWIPFEIFVAIWRAILLALLVWMAGPFTLFVLFTVPVASEINAGNIQIMLAAAIVIGFRFPASWAFVLLTKVTPGVGLLWFALRKRWRDLAIALGVTTAIVAVTFVLHPDRWFDYIALLTGSPAPAVAPYYLPFWIRLGPALAFIVFGAWRGYRWPVVVGSTLALPVFYTISPAMLVGVLPFAREALGRELDRRLPESASTAQQA